MKLRVLPTMSALVVLSGGLVWQALENSQLKKRLAAPSKHPSGISPSGPAGVAALPQPGAAQPQASAAGPGPRPLSPTAPRKGPPVFIPGGAFSTITVKQTGHGWEIFDAHGGQGVSLSAEEAARLASEIQASRAEQSTKLPGGPSWSPGQAAGPPDTQTHGDHSTAWASQSPDAGAEWLKTTFDRPVEIAEINIHESFNPGAVSKVSVIQPDGSARVIWEGTGSAESDRVERAVQVPPGVRGDQVLIELDTSRVPGWNEIDAVEIVGRDGTRQWAAESSASSYYGGGTPGGIEFLGGFAPDTIIMPPLPRPQGP